jgi:parallel beta-helix repeat protein
VLLAVIVIVIAHPHKLEKVEPKSFHDNEWLIATADAKDKMGIGFRVSSNMEYINKTINATADAKDKMGIGFRVSSNMEYINKTINVAVSNIKNNADPSNSVRTSIEQNSYNNNVNADAINGEILSTVKNDEEATAAASCGQVVTKDIILSNDLDCNGVGMIVKEDGITIRLNNHRLSFANTSEVKVPELEHVGILIPNQKNITIQGPGVITGFDKAIEFAGSKDSYVRGIALRGNKIGILLTASNSITIYNNAIYQNTVGIASQSGNDGKIVFNQILQNTDQGIVIMASQHFIISANSAIGNGQNGVFLDIHSSNNMLLSNNIIDQTIDLNNANGVPVDVLSNSFIKNSCRKAMPDGLC